MIGEQYFIEYLNHYKDLSQNEIKTDILKLAKSLLEMDEEANFFVYYTPLVLSFADGSATDSELEITNIINEKYKLNGKKVSAKDDPVELGEYINSNFPAYCEYYFAIEANAELFFFKKIFVSMIQYMCACISLKKSLSNKELIFLNLFIKKDLTWSVDSYDYSSQINKESSSDKKEIVGPVTFKDLRFLLHITDGDKKLITLESNFSRFNGVPFFYPVDDAGGMAEGSSLWAFLMQTYSYKNQRLHFDSMLYQLGIKKEFDQMSSFEKALAYLLCFDFIGPVFYISEVEKTIKYLENNCRYPALIDGFKEHIIVDDHYEEFDAMKIHVLSEDIEDCITPTSINLYLDASSNTIDISDLFQVATANINKEFCIGQYMFLYHFKDGIQKYEYMNRELLNCSLTEYEFDAFADVVEDESTPKNIKKESSLIDWIINQRYGMNVLRYKGEAIFLKFSYQSFANDDEDIEIENLTLFDPSLSPVIKLKLF